MGPSPPRGAIIDFHSHLLPDVDDGARSVDEALTAMHALAAQGVTVCVTTPHFDASLTRRPEALHERLDAFDRSWGALRAAIAGRSDLPELRRGTEVMLDDVEFDLGDPRIRLDGGPFVLCEYPGLRLPHSAEWGIESLVRGGWRPIVAHPERYRNVDGQLVVLERLRQAGAFFQLNSGSVIGHFGVKAAQLAAELLDRGWVDYLSSDYHARGAVSIAAAVAHLRARAGDELVRQLTVDNPQRMLLGEPPLPVTPLVDRPTVPWWRRIFARAAAT